MRSLADVRLDLILPAEAALAFVADAARTDGLGSVAWFEGEGARFALSELRGAIARRAQIDLGFDAGPETFCAMVAARTLGRVGREPALVHALCATFADNHWERRYRFFATPNGFAADSDCTGVALAALYQAGMLSHAELVRGARQLVENCVAGVDDCVDEVVLVYWDDDREPGVTRRGRKQDAAVACNALYAVLLAAEGARPDARIESFVEANLAYVLSALEHGTRTRYYGSPDALPWFAGELCARFPRARAVLGRALRASVQARLHAPGDALELAVRAATASFLGIDASALVRDLAARQLLSGGFAPGAFFTLGRIPGLCFGSSGLTTALAALALGPREAG